MAQRPAAKQRQGRDQELWLRLQSWASATPPLPGLEEAMDGRTQHVLQ